MNSACPQKTQAAGSDRGDNGGQGEQWPLGAWGMVGPALANGESVPSRTVPDAEYLQLTWARGSQLAAALRSGPGAGAESVPCV